MDEESITRIKDFIALLQKSLYVNDCVTSLPLEGDAMCSCEVSTACSSRAGMDLRKWCGSTIGQDEQSGYKVLDIMWCHELDTPQLDMQAILNVDIKKLVNSSRSSRCCSFCV